MKFCVRNFQIKIEGETRIQQIEGNRIKNLSILETEFVCQEEICTILVTVIPNYLYIK